MQTKILKIHNDDNVAVALTTLYKNETYNNVTLQENIPAKHKFALKDFNEGDLIIMYGVLVGKATKHISIGELISTQNIQHATNSYSLKERHTNWHKPDVSKYQNKTFNGFHRADGSVGTRNYWLVIPLVFCENKNVEVLQEAFMKALGYAPKESPYEAMVHRLVREYETGNTEYDLLFADEDEFETGSKKIFPNVDGIKFLKHTLGCGGTRDDARALCGLLAGYITHANVAGATVLSLGCQNAQIAILKEEIEKRDANFSKPLYLLEQQKIGNENKLLSEAIKKTFTD